MKKFKVYYDPEALSELCALSPYNLKKDLKDIEEDEREAIAEEIGNEICNGIDRPPTATALFWGNGRKAACAKIRTVDVERDAGKSNGYRCIVLVDYVNYAAFILHVYRHGHGEKDNIDKKSSNQLKKLVRIYIDSLEKIKK